LKLDASGQADASERVFPLRGFKNTVQEASRRVSALFVRAGFATSDGAARWTCHDLRRKSNIDLLRAGATLREIHDYAWPDPAWMDVSQIRSAALAYRREYAILGGDWSPFWHDAIDLLGMEDLLFKMHDEPALVDALLQHVVDYYFEVSRRIFDAAADAIDIFFIGNDFGSQFGPLVSPEWFARFLLPHLQRLIDLGHAYGLLVQLHCCGGFAPLLPLMIEKSVECSPVRQNLRKSVQSITLPKPFFRRALQTSLM
jgi:hypothetical protein